MSAAPPPTPAATLLTLVRKLIDYGKQLAASLQQRTADIAAATQAFGTSDIAQMLAAITRGLHRANALEARLAKQAARPHAEAKPARAPSQRVPRAAAETTQRADEADTRLVRLPTPEQIAAKVRRQPIGVVIADICRDLGILPNHPLWRELQLVIFQHGGNYAALIKDILQRSSRAFAERFPATAPPASPALFAPVPACTGPP